MFDKYNEFKEKQKQRFKDYINNQKLKLPKNIQDKITNFEVMYAKYKQTTLCEVIETIVFVIVMVIIIRFFICEIRYIPSGSMKPTLVEGDRIVVERYSRFFSKPERGDIMVFYPPSTILSRKPLPLFSRLTGAFCKDVAYIKRVIAVPGDTIEVKLEDDGSTYVYINGKKQKEPYIKSVYEYPICQKDLKGLPVFDIQIPKYCGPYKLPKDNYFMMGDNRGDSLDSRFWGTVTSDRFVGRAVTIFWPLKRIRILHKIDVNKN